MQVGSPEDLYNRPANKFIADFIGDPPINFVELPVHNVIIGGLGVKLPDKFSQIDKVIVGIRPDEALAGEDPNAVAKVNGKVEAIIYIGSRRYISVDIGEGKSIRVLALEAKDYREGDKITVSIRRLHIFDPKTEIRLLTFG
jgi:multiple sugar transport system ATP-binding protein